MKYLGGNDNSVNARVVRNITEDSVQNQNFRVTKYFKENKNIKEIEKKILKTIKSDDIDSFKFN